MTCFDVLQLVRYMTNDMQDAVTSAYEKLNAVNAANRYMRRLALEFKPNMLNVSETQKLLTDYNPNAMIINGYWDGLDTYNGGDYK